MGPWKVGKKHYSATCMNWEMVVSDVSYKHIGFTGLNHWYGLFKQMLQNNTLAKNTEKQVDAMCLLCQCYVLCSPQACQCFVPFLLNLSPGCFLKTTCCVGYV